MKTKDKNPETALYNALIFSSLALYVFYMCAKNVYSAEVVEIMRDFGVSKKDAGMSTSVSFFTYGIMQLLLARFLDRINIPKLLYATVPFAMLAYLLTAFCTDIKQVWVLFGIGGGLAAGIYPAILTVIGRYMPDRMLLKANRVIGFGFSLGFVTPYLGASLFIKLGNWRLAFIVFPIITLIITPIFCTIVKKCHKIYLENPKSAVSQKADSGSGFNRSQYAAFLTLSGMLCLFSGFIYYGILGWVTSLLTEVFGVPSSLSTLTSVLIPLAVYVGPLIQTRLCRKKSVWYVGTLFSVLALIFPIALAFIYKFNIVITLLLTIGLLILSRGNSSLSGLEIPLRYRDSVNSGTLGTVVNVFGCVGASLGPTTMGSVIDTYGHSSNYWFTAAVVILMIAFIIPGHFVFSEKKHIRTFANRLP